MSEEFKQITREELLAFLKDRRGVSASELKDESPRERLRTAVNHLNMALGYVEHERGYKKLKAKLKQEKSK